MQKTVRLKKPYPPQVRFLEAKARYIGYGGARGGGKSEAARMKAVLLALRWAGIQILFLRRHLNDLRENHVYPLIKLLNGVAVYREQNKEFLFPNGSRVILGYCAAEKDILQFQGQSYDVIFLEEATQFTEWQYDNIKLSNRPSGLCKGFRPRMYFTCNPGGVGHGWVKRLFIDRDYKNSERAEDFIFIPARVYDNKFIMENDPDYVRTLENLPDDLRKAMLDGDWDIFEGQYFKEFDRKVHVIEPFVIPSHWRRYRTLDYGLDMLACYWIAVDIYGRAVVYKELYEPNLIISEAAKKIAAMTTEPIDATFAPPDMWNRRQDTGQSVFDLFAEKGIILTKAQNDRVMGWLALKEWLQPFPDELGETTASLRITRNCLNLIRCLPALQYDQKNPNDCATEPHELTHAPDAIRYFIAGRPSPAALPMTEDEEEWEEASSLGSFLQYGG